MRWCNPATHENSGSAYQGDAQHAHNNGKIPPFTNCIYFLSLVPRSRFLFVSTFSLLLIYGTRERSTGDKRFDQHAVDAPKWKMTEINFQKREHNSMLMNWGRLSLFQRGKPNKMNLLNWTWHQMLLGNYFPPTTSATCSLTTEGEVRLRYRFGLDNPMKRNMAEVYCFNSKSTRAPQR